jgi:hypothetical protein
MFSLITGSDYISSPAKRPHNRPSTGLARDEFFLDVTVLNSHLEGPKRSPGSSGDAGRSLLWGETKIPAAWCGPEAGRLLVVRSPVGHAQDGDVLVGMQSSEGPEECLQSMEEVAGGTFAPRSMAFTPLAGPGSSLGWVNTILAQHTRAARNPIKPLGQTPETKRQHHNHQQQQQEEGQRLGRSHGLRQDPGGGCDYGNVEFQSLQLSEC